MKFVLVGAGSAQFGSEPNGTTFSMISAIRFGPPSAVARYQSVFSTKQGAFVKKAPCF